MVRFNPDYQLCHHIPVIAGIREKIWGGLSLFWKNETNTFHYLRPLCHSVPFRERLIAEAFETETKTTKCRQKGRAGLGRAGQSMITTFLTPPPHPVQ